MIYRKMNIEEKDVDLFDILYIERFALGYRMDLSNRDSRLYDLLNSDTYSRSFLSLYVELSEPKAIVRTFCLNSDEEEHIILTGDGMKKLIEKIESLIARGGKTL